MFTRSKLVLNLEGAKTVAAAARREAEVNSWNVCIAVVDDGGHLLYLERMDGCQIGSIDVATKKAQAAINYLRPTKDFHDTLMEGKMSILALSGSMPVDGGVPIIHDNCFIGAIGVSGVTAAQDGSIARKGSVALLDSEGPPSPPSSPA